MKILQINHFSYKAAGAIMMNLHNEMLKNGIDSYVAWGRGRKAENNHEYYMDDDLGVKLHGVYTRITDKTGFASTRSTKKLLDWIDGIKPDIIHLHCIHGYYINIKMLFEYIKKKDISVVWTQHDCWAFTGHCAYFDLVGCNKWKNGCFKCPQRDTYPRSLFLDNSKQNWYRKKEIFTDVYNMMIVTPSKWLARLIEQSFLMNYEVKVIYNGIDTNTFHPTLSDVKERMKIKDKKIILGVASEWTERKGLKDFIKLNDELHKTRNEYAIVIVGLNEKQLSSLPNGIIGIKRTSNIRELVELYSAANVFFNPTYEDNFPTTNIEALACGTPIITYDTGGSPEAVVDNMGCVVKQGDIASVLRAIMQMNKQSTSYDREKIKIFSVESMVEAYLDIYKAMR